MVKLSKNKSEEVKSLVKNSLSGYYDDSNNSLDITKVACNLGFNVIEIDLNDGERGAILVDDKRDIKIIAVNKNDSIKKKRFTIAHELGHYFLERDSFKEGNLLIKHRDIRGDEQNSIGEIKADYFASYTLIPEDKYLKFIKENFNLDIIQLDGIPKFKSIIAQEFDVTENVADAYMRSFLND